MSDTSAMEQYVHTLSTATAELARALDDGGPDDDRRLEFRPPLGTVQRRIVALDGMSRPEGMRVDEIARLANRPGGPNTHIVLDTLYRRGVVERLPGETYRLAASYRRRGDRATAPPALLSRATSA